MSFTKECCTLPPITSDYKPEGSTFKLGKDLSIYEAKSKSSDVMLICAHDIFGIHPNTQQFADKLNSSGYFRVVMPDFFRGEPIPFDCNPAERLNEIYAFIERKGSWDKIVKQDVIDIIEHYRKEGVTSFGTYGFCWGGKMSARAVCELDDIKAAVLIHPSLMKDADAEEAKAPVLFLPSMNEPDLIPMYETIKKNLGDDKCEHHRFDDVPHGFAGARGDWKNELQLKRANEAIAMTHTFFKKHLCK